MKYFKHMSERADLCYKNKMLEFCLKTFPRELFQFSGSSVAEEVRRDRRGQ